MTKEFYFPSYATLYLLRRMTYLITPSTQNVVEEVWKVEKFQSTPIDGCSVFQINEQTDVSVSDLLVALAMSKEVLELEASWSYRTRDNITTLHIKNKVGRLTFSNPEIENEVGQSVELTSAQTWQFP